MFAVIFEVQPKKKRWNDYLCVARQLKPKLEATDGFIDNKRFRSWKTVGRLLSLSIWRDEKALIRWRTHGGHHSAQIKGRFKIFEDYHLRVGEITADNAPLAGVALEEKRFDTTAVGEGKVCTLTEILLVNESKSIPAADSLLSHLGVNSNTLGLLDHEVFESISNPRKLLVLGSWRDDEAAASWKPIPFEGASDLHHRVVRIIRDYGMFERREAPQFYPGVKRADSCSV